MLMNDAWVSRSLMVSKPPFAHSAMPMSLKSCFLFFWTCLRSWEAALCSAGSKVRVHKMSSRNSMVRFFKLWFPSKSFKKKFTLVLGHEDEDGKRAQSVKVSLSCHLSVLGDPVPQDGKHPHGRRRTRDGHLPPCRLPKWVGGGVLRQYLFLWYKPTALALSQHWVGHGDYWSRQWRQQMPQPRGRSSTWRKYLKSLILKVTMRIPPVGLSRGCYHHTKFARILKSKSIRFMYLQN